MCKEFSNSLLVIDYHQQMFRFSLNRSNRLTNASIVLVCARFIKRFFDEDSSTISIECLYRSDDHILKRFLPLVLHILELTLKDQRSSSWFFTRILSDLIFGYEQLKCGLFFFDMRIYLRRKSVDIKCKAIFLDLLCVSNFISVVIQKWKIIVDSIPNILFYQYGVLINRM